MQIDWTKYQAAGDKATALTAVLESHKERVATLRRDKEFQEYTIRRGLRGALSRQTMNELQIHSTDHNTFIWLLNTQTERVLEATTNNADPISPMVRQFLSTTARLAVAEDRLAVTERQHREAQGTYNRMRDFIRRYTGNDTQPMPRIV